MDDERARAHARAQHARHLDPIEQERIRCPALGGRLRGLCHQRSVGHTNARQLKRGAKMKGEASTAGVITPGRIRDDHLGSGWQRAYRRLKQRALALRQ
jgi:hypothetical protein